MPNQFELTFVSKSDIEKCFEAFAEVDTFIAYHPNAYKYDKLGDNKYRIFEKALKIAPTTTFVLEINANFDEKWVKYDARLFGFIKIQILLRFTNLNPQISTDTNKTKILETVNLNFGFPIKQFLRFAFSLFHSQMINNLDKGKTK